MRPTRILGYLEMRTIKSFLMSILFSVVGLGAAHAQYYDDYYSDLQWEWQQQQILNQMQNQTMMMSQQVLNYYRQQAAAATYNLMNYPMQPMQGVYTYDGVYVTPETVNNYHREKVDCDNCDGGYIYRQRYVGNGEVKQTKRRCGMCHGRGYVTRTVAD